jgi:restriction system protein
MSIPRHDQIRLPALQLLAKHDTLRLKKIEKPLAEQFNLSDEELSQTNSPGNGTTFYDRISWALHYLKTAELVLKPKWGTYQISELGKTKLGVTSNEINHYINPALKYRSFKG